MSTVKNFNVGGVDYPVQDAKATPFLSSADEATLLSNGTYRGDEVANNTIFADSDGVLKKFTKTVVDKTWQTGTAQTRIGRTNLSIHDQVSAQNGNYVVTSLYYGDARRSTDRGATWVSAGSSSYNASSTSCTVYVQKTGKFYCGTSVGLLATDGTASFSRVGSSTSSVTTYATDGNILCCFGGCYTFDNEGTPTWTAANYSVVAARYDSVSGVFYGQRQSTNGYYESTDGYTWTLIGSPGQYFNWVAKRGNVVVGFRRNGASNTKRYVSTDGGVTWTSEAFADQEWFGGVYQGLFYMGRTGGAADFMISTDGLTWTQMNRPDTASAQALVMVDDKVYMGNYAYYFTTGIDYDYALTPISYTKTEVDTALADKQTAAVVGSSDPTSSLRKNLGDRYLNSTDGTTFVCTKEYEAPLTTVNYTVNGSPTISSEYVLSNCSASNYITGSQQFNCATSASSTWAIETEITLPSSLSGRQHYMAIGTGDHILIQEGSYLYWSMSNWGIGFESSNMRHSVTAGKTYTMRMEYDGTSLNWYISDDGTIPSTPTHTYAASGTKVLASGNSIYFGTRPAYSSQYAQGSINLLKTKIYASGALYWEAVTQTGGQDAEWTKLQNEIEVVPSLPATPTAGTVYFVTGG